MSQTSLPQKWLSREWLEGSRKRLEIAHLTRLSKPRLSMEILLTLFDELLARLCHETAG
jgi:hypothetical protein